MVSTPQPIPNNVKSAPPAQKGSPNRPTKSDVKAGNGGPTNNPSSRFVTKPKGEGDTPVNPYNAQALEAPTESSSPLSAPTGTAETQLLASLLAGIMGAGGATMNFMTYSARNKLGIPKIARVTGLSKATNSFAQSIRGRRAKSQRKPKSPKKGQKMKASKVGSLRNGKPLKRKIKNEPGLGRKLKLAAQNLADTRGAKLKAGSVASGLTARVSNVKRAIESKLPGAKGPTTKSPKRKNPAFA